MQCFPDESCKPVLHSLEMMPVSVHCGKLIPVIFRMAIVCVNSQQARSATEFGKSWIVNPDMCHDVNSPEPPVIIHEDGEVCLTAAKDLCYYLKDPSGK